MSIIKTIVTVSVGVVVLVGGLFILPLVVTKFLVGTFFVLVGLGVIGSIK